MTMLEGLFKHRRVLYPKVIRLIRIFTRHLYLGGQVLLFQRVISFCMIALVSGAVIGCGDSGPRIVPVKGVVTFKGKPIGNINVMFVPSDGKGRIAQGTSDASGSFSLQTEEPGDGAMMGDYKVSFKFQSSIVPDMPGFAGGIKPEPSPIPLKYGDENKSGFTAKVEATNDEFKFDLE